jgi:hypothetical protein
MTLAFLGDTDEAHVPTINQILSTLDPSSVVIEGPHTYTEQQKLAFLEYHEEGGSAIWEQINKELGSLLGYKPNFSPWLPHTTVWRYAPENAPNVNPPLPSLSFTPTAVTLYQSVNGIYTPVTASAKTAAGHTSIVTSFGYIDGHLYTGPNHIEIVMKALGDENFPDNDTNPMAFGYIWEENDGEQIAEFYSDFYEEDQDKEIFNKVFEMLKKKYPKLTQLTLGPSKETVERMDRYFSNKVAFRWDIRRGFQVLD